MAEIDEKTQRAIDMLTCRPLNLSDEEQDAVFTLAETAQLLADLKEALEWLFDGHGLLNSEDKLRVVELCPGNSYTDSLIRAHKEATRG